jgi:hypothetical protein
MYLFFDALDTNLMCLIIGEFKKKPTSRGSLPRTFRKKKRLNGRVFLRNDVQTPKKLCE